MNDNSYKSQLRTDLINTKAIYNDLVQQYADDKTSVSDPDWEEKIDKINLAKVNWITAKSRIDGLNVTGKAISNYKIIV